MSPNGASENFCSGSVALSFAIETRALLAVPCAERWSQNPPGCFEKQKYTMSVITSVHLLEIQEYSNYDRKPFLFNPEMPGEA